jgi:nitroreductase
MAAIEGRTSTARLDPERPPRELVELVLRAALRAPNHHLSHPWRFTVLAGDARREVGEAHARAVARTTPACPPELLAKEAAKLERAPVVVVCHLPVDTDPVRAREDRDAVAAGVENLLLAAQAHGLGAMWRTGSLVDEPEVRDALGLGEGDAIVAFVYLGWPTPASSPRRPSPRPDLERVAVWRGW